MKKIYLLLFAMLLTGSMAMAQDDNSNKQGKERRQFDPTEMATRETNQMVKTYSLNDSQKSALLELNKSFAQQRSANMSKFRPTNGERPDEATMKQMRTQMEQQQTGYMAGVKKILTADQYAKFEKDQKSRHQHGGMHGQHGGQQGESSQQGNVPEGNE